MGLKYLKNLSVLALLGITLFGASQQAHAAGTLPIAMAQQMDINGQPVLCQVNFFVAGTPATPQNSYADFGLTQVQAGTLSCDQTGRVPMFWLADGLVHVRMIDGQGLSIIDTTMQVLGPSSGGGGGGGTVDPTAIASTGDVKWRLDKSPIAGWVRANGLTIGTTGSGATERANTDTQTLYVYIWTNFSSPSGNTICPVSGGLGASALADFNAGKQLTLQDARARSIFGLDDMGNSALGGFPGVTFAVGNATTGGARGGSNQATLSLAQLPTGITSGNGSQSITVSGTPNISVSGSVTITSSGTNSISVNSTAGTWVNSGGNPLASFTPGGGGAGEYITGTAGFVGNVASTGSNSISVSGSNTFAASGLNGLSFTQTNAIGVTSNNTGAQAHPTANSNLLGTLFWKL